MSGRTAVRGLALACHPGPALAVTALAGLLAVTAGATATTTALVVVAFLVGQLSVGWANDWLDADRDATVGRSDKPVATGQVGREVVRVAALTALTASVPLSLTLGVRAGVAHVVAVASAWAYDLGLKSTPWSWVPFAVSFGLLPDVVVLALPGHHLAPWWLVAAGALLGIGAHLVNVLPDLDDDHATGIRGFPHRLGRKGSAVGAASVLVTAAALVALAPPGRTAPAALVVLGVAVVAAATAAVTGARGRGRLTPLVATAVVAAAAVVLLLASGARLG
ncbi:UbiA family prenyltransferase [Angustibacter peucedani]